MSLRGLPDFSAPVGAAIYRAFDLTETLVAVPDGIAVARDADGFPMLRLERFRGIDPGRPPAAYGLLTVWLALTAPAPSRQVETGVAPLYRQAIPDRGVIRVYLDQVDSGISVPPSPMPWDGSLTAIWGTRLSTLSATMIEQALANGLLPLHAAADLELRGVAPRLPVQVKLDWPTFVTRMSQICDTDGLVRRSDLVHWLQIQILNDRGSSGPIRVLTGQSSVEDLAETLADWFRARFGKDATQLGEDSIPGALRVWLDPSLAGALTWDLSEPLLTWRPLVVVQDLHPQLSKLGTELSRYCPSGRTIPAIDLGWATIDVLANLPSQQVGVLACGVDLIACPHPPQRHQAAIASCEFTADVSRAWVTLRLSPGEDIVYQSQAWMLVEDPRGVRTIEGPRRECRGERLMLQAADFGVRFIPVSADDGLLDVADVRVTLLLRFTEFGSVDLRRGQRDAVFVATASTQNAVDANGADLVLLVQLRSHVDGRERALEPVPAAPLWLGLAGIPGWGAHELAIDGRALPDPFTALELRPELADESQATVVTLSASGPTRTWRYFSNDPLHAGYCYRVRPLGQIGPWLGPFPAEQPLVLGVGL